MTKYFVQAVNADGIIDFIKTDDYGDVMAFKEAVRSEGLSVREPWHDLDDVTEREFGRDGYGASTQRKLIDMSQAQKEGAAEVSLA